MPEVEETEKKSVVVDYNEREIPIHLGGRLIILRRWGWVKIGDLLPKIVDVFQAVIGVINSRGAVGELSQEDIWSIVSSAAATNAANKARVIHEIQIETLIYEPKNGFKSAQEAVLFLDSLDFDEGIELSKTIFFQNTENLRKNLIGLTLPGKK